MCGRIVQATSPEEIAREFGADLSVGVQESMLITFLAPSVFYAYRMRREAK
jgi:hypothetical protein